MDDGHEGVGEHSKGDLAAPGGIAAGPVFIGSDQTLLGLEGLLDPPPGSGRIDQGVQRDRCGGVAPIVDEFAGGCSCVGSTAGGIPVQGKPDR